MPRGVVKWFNNTMKYGFITQEEGEEVFVHFSEIQVEGYKTLKKGDLVEFDLEGGDKGRRALRVRIIESAKQAKKKKQSAGGGSGETPAGKRKEGERSDGGTYHYHRRSA